MARPHRIRNALRLGADGPGFGDILVNVFRRCDNGGESARSLSATMIAPLKLVRNQGCGSVFLEIAGQAPIKPVCDECPRSLTQRRIGRSCRGWVGE